MQLKEYYRLKGEVNVKAASTKQEQQTVMREHNKDKDTKNSMGMRLREIQMREEELKARK